ncbi:MAG: alpha/beta hydrolase [Alphaproteobacteria bacterium]|nr:alpha/beta hydrolase [Alphaproteobacteria bacterium]
MKTELLAGLRKVLFTLGVLYFAMVAVLFVKQRDFIYLPDKTAPSKSLVNADGAVQDIEVHTEDDLSLKAWFIAPDKANMPVILFFHGNAGNISNRLFKISDYIEAGYGVLMAEYRGYGGNPSTPSEEGLYADARAYFSWLNAHGYKDEDLILYGESLGSGVATEMAAQRKVKALILEAPFARLSDPAKKTYFFIPFIEHLMHDKFLSIKKIDAVHAPTLFLIAGKDEVLGAQTGLNLFETASEPKTLKIFENASHNGTYQYGASAQVLLFLSTL